LLWFGHTRTPQPTMVGLAAWLASLRQRVGPLSSNRYSGILKKAKTTQDLLDVISDHDKHFDGPPDRAFFCAAATCALTLPNCPSVIAARLLDRVPAPCVHEATHRVALRVINKAAAEHDEVAARMAFSRLIRYDPIASATMLQLKGADDNLVRQVLEEMLAKASGPDTDPTSLSWALKKASSFKDSDLVERVWEWSLCMRQHLLQCTSTDHMIAVNYIQYVHAMSRMGHLDKAILAWKEWRQSRLGSSDSAPRSDFLRSTMVAAAAYHGDAETAEELYRARPATYAVPTPGFAENNGMLLSLLTAYSHAGLPEWAVSLLRDVESAGPVDIRVYNAAIDACARAGRFAQAQSIITDLCAKGVKPDSVTWMALLGLCRKHLNIAVAEYAFNQILQLDNQNHSSAFVVLGNVYRAAGRDDLAEELHQRRLRLGIYKQRGAVDVSVGGQVHTFHVGEIPKELDAETAAIEAKLEEWTRILSTNGVSTESILCRHSEKLALAFAVVKGQKDITLRKNLRICSACHKASCAITSVEGVVIRHQDQSRVHIMQDGVCSCNGRY
jgi:pentatricopeptide repeat protein